MGFAGGVFDTFFDVNVCHARACQRLLPDQWCYDERSMKPGQKVAYGRSHVGDRVIARIVERPDGTAYLETWSAKNPRGWIEGGASLDDFFFARAVPAAMAKMQRFLALVRDRFISKSFNFSKNKTHLISEFS
jgi:hypothetical protein